MLDLCELSLCYSSSHTHIARLRSTNSIQRNNISNINTTYNQTLVSTCAALLVKL